MTTRVNKNTGDTTTYVWDIENKLTEVRKPGMIAKYTYDAVGRRMSKTVNGETKKFGYDGNDMILETNDKDSIVADYTHGPGIDNPLAMHRNGSDYYYVKDGLGSVTALTDNSGNVVHEYKYSVFGKIVDETGDSVENPFTFTSREMDRETGLMYYRARYYEPGIGRFLSEDPIQFNSNDANFYRYVWNDPLNFVDLTGLYGECEAQFFPKNEATIGPRYPKSLAGLASVWIAEKLGASYETTQAMWDFFDGVYEIGDYASLGMSAVGAVKFSNSAKLLQQMQDRGWTMKQIEEAMQTPGIPAMGKNGPATRYVHPETGQSVVVDNKTGEVFHVGGPGYKY